jgi:hypothetical protein
LLCGNEGVNVKEKERVVFKYMNMYNTLASGEKTINCAIGIAHINI